MLHAAQRAALLVIRNGGATPVAERMFDNILRAHGQDAVETVWRLDFIAASRARSGEGAYLRNVGALTLKLALVGEVEALAERAMAERTRIDEVYARLRRLEALPSPCPRSALVAGAASAAGFLAHMLARDEGAVVVAFVAAAPGQGARLIRQRRGLSAVALVFVSATRSALVAGARIRLGLVSDTFATLVASVAYLVPGLLLINGFMDLLSQRYLAIGLERMAKAFVLFLVIAIGIALADALVLYGRRERRPSIGRGPCVEAVWTALFSVALAMMYTAPLRALLPTLAAGLAGSFVRDLSVASHVGPNWATPAGRLRRGAGVRDDGTRQSPVTRRADRRRVPAGWR